MLVHHTRYQDEVRLLLQIHDELIFEVKDGILEKAAEEIRQVMETAFILKVPIKVGVRVGEHLGTMHPFLLHTQEQKL